MNPISTIGSYLNNGAQAIGDFFNRQKTPLNPLFIAEDYLNPNNYTKNINDVKNFFSPQGWGINLNQQNSVPHQLVAGASINPSPTPAPGENAWVDMMRPKMHNVNDASLHKTYQNALKAPDFTGNYYGVTPTPIPRPSADQLQKNIISGLHGYSPNVDLPIATASAALAQAGSQLPDPYLPTIISIIESGGGRYFNRGQNNLYNMNADNGGVTYPDYNTAILGGGPNNQQGLLGVLLHSGVYDKYLKSGSLPDFLNHFTPPGPAYSNATLDKQMERYNSIRKYFPQ